MKNHEIRIYESPYQELPCNIIGFGSKAINAASDPKLAEWFQTKRYIVGRSFQATVPVIDRQAGENVAIRHVDIDITAQPRDVFMALDRHIMVRPPVADSDLKELGNLMVHLDTYGHGENQISFTDYRLTVPDGDGHDIENANYGRFIVQAVQPE